MLTTSTSKTILLTGLLLLGSGATLQAQPWGDGEPPWVKNRRERQAQLGALPPRILAQQSREPVRVPEIEEMIRRAQAAAERLARELIDEGHHQGRIIHVPREHPTIQQGIDAARPGDTVLVAPGTYHELLVLRDGVRLRSSPEEGGDELVDVPGARLQLPRRTLRTIVDGTGTTPSHHGMVDFLPGVGRHTIIDGFTLQNLPAQDHHVPGHAHAVNVRGASPVIMHCIVRNCGSTGIGSHVVYQDQTSPIETRDFRRANIRAQTAAVIYHNVIHGNLGLGIGCNHFSTPYILGNEVFGNDDSALGEAPSPGIGCKHGSAPTLVGNLVHDNPGGGILCKRGLPQGAHPVDVRTRPTIRQNVVFQNGTDRPGISAQEAGSVEEPVRMTGNMVLDTDGVALGMRAGAVGILEDNLVVRVRSRSAGIAVMGSTALRLSRNQVTEGAGSGVVLGKGSVVYEMLANATDHLEGPSYVDLGCTFGAPLGGLESPFGLVGSYVDSPTTRRIYRVYGGFPVIQDLYLELGVRWDLWAATASPLEALAVQVERARLNGVNLVVTVTPTQGEGLVELARACPSVRCWQLPVPVDEGSPGIAPAEYAHHVRASIDSLRTVDPDCTIVLGTGTNLGSASPSTTGMERLTAVLGELGATEGRGIDVLAFPFAPPPGTSPGDEPRMLRSGLASARAMLRQHGHGDTPIWVTGIRSGNRPDNEVDEARHLFLCHVVALASGAGKVFWSHLTEGPWPDREAGATGLVHHPITSGSTSRKLAYHTYRYMRQALDGAVWSRVEEPRVPAGVEAYQVPVGDTLVLILWQEQVESRIVQLPFRQGRSCRIREAIPSTAGAAPERMTQALVPWALSDDSPPLVTFELGAQPVLIELGPLAGE